MSEHHHHHHEEEHDSSQTLSTREKLAKLLEHWIRHNQDHAKTYVQWADQAEAEGLPRVAALLREAAEKNDAVSRAFEQAAALLEA